jgi:hypothetical protein
LRSYNKGKYSSDQFEVLGHMYRCSRSCATRNIITITIIIITIIIKITIITTINTRYQSRD